MTPQDPQSPLNDQNAVPQQPGADLNAQIPPTYAPGGATAPSTGSPLQDAVNAQLNSAPMVDSAAPTPVAAPMPVVAPADPAAAAVEAHIADPEPNPLAGFTDPAVAAAPVAPVMPAVAAPTDTVSVAPQPIAPEPAPIAPAPMPTQAYDPSQDVGVGAPASSYPSAPEPLPPNPLEMDAATAPPAPFLPEQPIAAAPAAVPAPMPEPAPMVAPMGPEPMPVAPTMPEPAPAAPEPAFGQQFVDPAAGAGMAPVDPAMAGTDPTLQSMLDDPAANPAAGVDPYSDPALMAAASSSSGKAKGGKGIFMAVGIGAAVLIFGIIVLALILGRKPTTEVPADSLSGDQEQSQSVSTEPTITVPEGYTAIVKECYEFGLPTDNTVPTDDTSCKLDATFGAQGVSTIAVLPSITVYEDLEKAVVASKEANKITAANTVSERQITLGGFDAKEVVFNAGTTEAPQNKTMVVVVLKDSKYKLDGEKITSFEINMTSSDEFTKAAVSTLESTWSWK